MPAPRSPLLYRTPVSKRRCTLAKSLGFSREFNSRNIEHYWYPAWNHTLLELIADIPNLIVAPQFPLWFVPDVEEEEEEPEGAEDGEDLDEDEDAWNDLEDIEAESEDGGRSSDLFEDTDVGNASFSSGSTIPQKNARSQFVDYAIVRVAAVSHRKMPSRYEGWRISEEHVPLLVEEKRYPSRSLKKDELQNKLRSRLVEAHQSLKIQALHLFYKYPGTKSVMAIAASGPYWSYTTIHRMDSMSKEEFIRILNTGNYTLLERSIDQLTWTAPQRLDTDKSNLRFQTIYKRLRDLPGMKV